MSSKNFFVEGRNKRSALRRPSSARFEAAYGEKRFFWHARNQRPAFGDVRRNRTFPSGRGAMRCAYWAVRADGGPGEAADIIETLLRQS